MKTTITFLLFICVQASGQTPLHNYLQTAAENNPGLKASFNEYMAALEKVPQAGALPDPTVAFGFFIQPVETRLGPQQARMSLSQMFPWFGTLGAQENAAIQLAKAKYEMFGEAKARLFYDIRSTWYNLYLTNKAITITSDNIKLLNTLQQLALVKIEAGKASAVDELRVEMEILEMENHMKLLLDKLNTQKTVFNNLLNVDDTSEVYLPDLLDREEINLNREAVLDSIRINNHQVLSLEFQEASYEYEKMVARNMGKPGFSIGIDYSFIGESSNTALSPDESGRDAIVFPAVGIRIPLYRKKYTSMVKEAALRQEAVQNYKSDKVNILESIYEKANADYLDAERRIELHTRQQELAGKALRILESEYATNGTNFVEILRMKRQLLTHSLEVEKARSDMNASVSFIWYLMGR